MTDPQRPLGRPRTQSAYWLCQLAGWGLYGLSQFYAAIWFLGAPWGRVAAEILVLHAAGLGLTHALRDYARRRLWNALRVWQLAWRIALASVVLAIPMGLATNFLVVAGLHNPAIVIPDASTSGGIPLVTLLRISLQVANWTAVFTAWLVIYSIGTRLREQRFAELRQSELARALQLAELRLLKSQLNPHFLFNALNTVRSLVAHDPSRAQDAVTRLANTLRYTLNSSHDELVALAQELEIVNDYLELESMRFEERLSVELDIPADLRSTRIPVMLLQTVVENAIKHGIAELPAGGVLRIQALLRGDSLVIRVENPKPPTASSVAREGVGLRNSAERLRLLFGSRASLELDLSQPSVATTQISIPRNL
jgi:LytS/YehU family sensor histidine kinase